MSSTPRSPVLRRRTPQTRRSASELAEINWVVNDAWYDVVPGKVERDMKKALHKGDSETLNVYSANIGAGLLGWAYYPKGYNNGRDYIDGVVTRRVDARRAGRGRAVEVRPGDTLTHEVGHWLLLYHTFNAGCSASGDFVADTPKEAVPQFDCPVGADTCAAPGWTRSTTSWTTRRTPAWTCSPRARPSA